MKHLSVDEYHSQKADCDGLCDITDLVAEEKDYLRCVKCPFCSEIVTAELTPSTISCPECKITVNR